MKSAARIVLLVLALAVVGIASADGPGDRRHHRPHGLMELALVPEVQAELKLDEGKVEKLTQRRLEFRQKAMGLGQEVLNLSPAQRDARFRAMQEEEQRKVAEVLDASQMKRLKQIELQTMGIRGVARPEWADRLHLSQDQKQKIQGLLQSERDTVHQMFQSFPPSKNLSPEMREDLRRRFSEVRDIHTATDGKLRDVLTERQKQKFESLKGAPFKFADRAPTGA